MFAQVPPGQQQFSQQQQYPPGYGPQGAQQRPMGAGGPMNMQGQLQQGQPQPGGPNPIMQSQASGGMVPSGAGMVPSGMADRPSSVFVRHRRPGPYPTNPQSYMHNKRFSSQPQVSEWVMWIVYLPLGHCWTAQFKLSVTWSCGSLPRFATASDWKLLRFVKRF